jgi:methionyl-tRNA formyltransferase
MNIVLFGSTDLTLSVAEFLYAHSYKIVAIVTAPEVFNISYKMDGVKNVRFVNMHSWGIERNIPVISYHNSAQAITELGNLMETMDFSIVVGWYHMVPRKIRNLFSYGCAGFHASMLPKLRGGAPLNWAIILGMKETGVSFFELSDGVDDGLLYAQEKFPIEKDDHIQDLVNKSEAAIIKMLDKILPKIKRKDAIRYQQVGIASYCGQRIPEDSLIDWSKSAEDILLLIRASARPYAGAYTSLENQQICIWSAEPTNLVFHGAAGQILILHDNVYVSCLNTSILIKECTNSEDKDYMSVLLKSNHKRLLSKC